MPDSIYPKQSFSNGNGHFYFNGYYANGHNAHLKGSGYITADDEIVLKHLFLILMRCKWTIGITLVYAIGAVIYLQSQIPVYKSQGSLLIADTHQTQGGQEGVISPPP
ncbi:hypothetical protein BH23BAC3_BH23BAC3_36210 [soil metagenome]